MKRILVGGIVLLVLALVIAGCAGLSKEPAAPTPTAQAAPASVKTGGLAYGGQIIAEGQAVPVRSAALSLAVRGHRHLGAGDAGPTGDSRPDPGAARYPAA